MNSVTLFGRTGQDITLTSTSNDKKMVKFWLAVSDNGTTSWIPCIAWGSRAELIAKYVCKGDQLLIRGKLRPNKYTDKDNQKRWDMSVEVSRVTFISDKKERNDAQ